MQLYCDLEEILCFGTNTIVQNGVRQFNAGWCCNSNYPRSEGEADIQGLDYHRWSLLAVRWMVQGGMAYSRRMWRGDMVWFL